MAQHCVYGGECSGCMECYEEREPVGVCAVCGREIYVGDNAIETDDGYLCGDGECIAGWLGNADREEISDYINDYAEDFLKELKWEIIEAILSGAENQENCKSIVDKFLQGDADNFGDWRLSRMGYEPAVIH